MGLQGKLLKDLKSWLKREGNSEARLAVMLGYRDAAPIKQWLRRERIPSYQEVRVTQIVKENPNVSAEQRS
jgi:hypothetical protein